jgi:hypothetical protein
MKVEAGLGVTHVFAEAKHHTKLIRIDTKESGKSPDNDREQNDQGNPSLAEVAPRKRGPQPVLATAQEFFEIGRL